MHPARANNNKRRTRQANNLNSTTVGASPHYAPPAALLCCAGHAIMLAIMLVGAALPPRKSRVRPQRAVDEGAAAGAAEGTPAAVAAPGKEVAAEAAKGADLKKEK